MTTIKDVAGRAGVGLGTASRVLTGDRHTSAESRARVMQAARELGYVANGPARSLRRAKTDVIGLMISDVRNPFFSDLAHAAESESHRHGYTVLLTNTDEDPRKEVEHLRTFATQRIDGLLVAPDDSDPAPFLHLVAENFPLVLVDRAIAGLDVPTITSDNAGGVRQAMGWLSGRGCRRIAFVGGPSRVSTSMERLLAYREACQELDLDTDDRLVGVGDFRMASGGDVARQILASGIRPDAFLVADGLMTVGVLRALRSQPESNSGLDIVSFDDAPWFELTDPPVSAVHNDAAEIARRGVTALMALIAGEPAVSSRVPTRFIERTRP